MWSEFEGARGLQALVGATAWARLAQCGLRRRYRRGDALVRQGDHDRYLLLLVAGRVQVMYSAADGSGVLLAVRGPGDVIGEFALQDAGPRSASVLALEPCTAYQVSGEVFNEFIRRHHHEPLLTQYVTAKVRESATRTWQVAAARPESRLAALLLAILDAAGPRHPCPHQVLMSQEELSRALGLSRSSITPVLLRWKEQGVVAAGRGQLRVIDVARLASLAP